MTCRREVVRRSVALCLTLALVACGGERGGLDSALLITLDTTRRDALGAYGAPAGLTPALDELARGSVVFEEAYAVAPLTLPAHASLLTGLIPPRHGLRVNTSHALPDEAVTLAELARARGLATAAFVSAVVLDRGFGLDQGFELWDQPRAPLAATGEDVEARAALETARRAASWLRDRPRGRGFLLWVHLYDTHAPYAPAAALRARAGGDLYLGEVAAQDDAAALLLQALDESDARARTLVVVVADHGESRGDGGEATHGYLASDATLRIPLLVRDPLDPRPPRRVPGAVGTVDLFPTLVEALGLGPLGAVDGTSLLRRDPPADHGAYFEAPLGALVLGWAPIVGWADGAGVFRSSDTGRELPASVRVQIAGLLARPSLSASPSGGPDPRLARALDALGYAWADATAERMPDPLVTAGRPAPSTATLALYQEAERQVANGRDAEALAGLVELCAREPGNPGAWLLLGTALLHLDRPAQAIDALEHHRALRGSWLGVELHLGLAHDRLGHSTQALEHFQRALAFEPGLVEVVERVIRLLEERGDVEAARPYWELRRRALAYRDDPSRTTFVQR
jgi:hypothetical protein